MLGVFEYASNVTRCMLVAYIVRTLIGRRIVCYSKDVINRYIIIIR